MKFSVEDLRKICNLSDQNLAEYLNLNLSLKEDAKRVENIKSSLSIFLNSIDEESLERLITLAVCYLRLSNT